MVAVMHTDMGEVNNETVRPKVTDAKGILKQNREFLDYFWDIAKPEREIRLPAIENLIEHLKKSEKSDELKYSLKRLVDGLSHTREDARSGYSVALAQVLSIFEEISLKSTLDSIKEKHNLQTAKKKLIRNAAFGNFFGVLALSQSTRLQKEPQILLECVQVLQSLSHYREHLKDLPRKTIVDILSETSTEVFEEVLLKALKSDLTSALNTPEQLELLLVAIQKFPSVLKPKKLKKLLGTTTVITEDSLPKLVDVLKMAARSVKKEAVLPPVALDLLQASLREENFEMFWTEAIIKGMISDGHTQYLSFRLLGAGLPLLSVSQLEFVLSGDVMRHYGEHVLSAQLPYRFKFAPEMERYVSEFMQGCADADRQLTVVLGFTRLTNRGYPVVPSHWKVLDHMVPSAAERYVEWLIEAFCNPQLDECLDFSTHRQKGSQDKTGQENDDSVTRFRKWIIQRLAFVGENHQIKKDEELVMNIARFIFFHAFFDVKKPTSDIPETTRALLVPIDQQTRSSISSAFYSLLQSLNSMPVLGDVSETEGQNSRRILGVKTDGSLWIYCLVQYAATLLNQSKHVRIIQAFSPEQREGWDSMLESVEALRKKSKKTPSPKHTAFQHLFLLIGIQMFKDPKESVDLLKDLRSCMERAQAKKSKKKKATGCESSEEEPHWVEVVVEILLSLLSQPSRLVRNVCRVVFTRICPQVTQGALDCILNVLDPSKDEDESGVVVTDEKKKHKDEEDEDEEGNEEEDEEDSDSSDDDDEDEKEEDEAMEEGEDVDQNFRLELMKVLQGQNALAKEEDSDEDELDDEAMMKLDGSLSSLFLEQKKKIQAKKDEKDKLRKEKVLVREFKIKVLDLVEIFLNKQGSSSLVLGLVEPLLSVIENGMSSETNQQEQDYLRRAADIFRNQLCRGKYYCKDIEGREAELYEMLERLIGRAQKLADSSVSLYYFSAALYLVKVLKGVKNEQDSTNKQSSEGRIMGKVDVDRVTSVFRDALTSFMTRRKNSLTGAMFIDLFSRFPVLCVNLLDTAVENITGGLRDHQKGQACAMVLKALQSKEVKNLMSDSQWTELCQKIVKHITKVFEDVQCKNKAVHEKMVKALELCQYLVKTVLVQKMRVDLDGLQNVLKSMNADGSLQKAGQLEDTYWSVMKLFGVVKPKIEKVKKVVETEETEKTTKKKKGFLPETKKRKNRMKPTILEGQETPAAGETPEGTSGKAGKKKKSKNKKRKQQGEETAAQSPAKKAKTQKQQNKKKKKKGGDEK